MKIRRAFLAGVALAMGAGPAQAEKPLNDYSFIRRVNHGMNAEQAVLVFRKGREEGVPLLHELGAQALGWQQEQWRLGPGGNGRASVVAASGCPGCRRTTSMASRASRSSTPRCSRGSPRGPERSSGAESDGLLRARRGSAHPEAGDPASRQRVKLPPAARQARNGLRTTTPPYRRPWARSSE